MAEETESKDTGSEGTVGDAEGQAEAKPKGQAKGKPEGKPEGKTEPGSPAAEGQDEQPAEAPVPAKRGKGRPGRTTPSGVAHIRATFNNTSVSITDAHGGMIAWSSAGRAGFRGSRKSTAFAATMVGQDAARQALSRGMHEVDVRVQGAGAGRESAIRALQSAGLMIAVITDVTPIPHNGCRPRKRRRV